MTTSGADASTGSIEFIGNATTLIRYGGFTLLTDPNFLHRGQRAYLGYGLVSKRLTDPSSQVEDLPELDAVLLSHLHGDHWDRIARRSLDRGLPILTTPHASRRLQARPGFRRAMGLRTWDSHTLVKGGRTVRVTALPGKHAFGVVAALLPPVMGSLLEFGDVSGRIDYRLYVTGDTLVFDGLHEIARRHPDIDLGVLHLGGTRLPGGVLVTMDGKQGAELLQIVRPRQAVPIHYDDYTVFTSPLSDFTEAVRWRGLPVEVTVVDRGGRVALT
ncbi:MAG: MBL fold metallo-hydrolase [Actinomycetota bacterium]|nr:MBL fold metallo-hydrolase [Actinomycetota bacterium]